MLTALQGHFTKIISKVRKLRRERERSLSTAVSTTACLTTTEPEKLSKYQQYGASRSRIAADRLSNAHFQLFVV